MVEEIEGGVVQRVYTYGETVISQSQRTGASFKTSYYGYDAHWNVTFLTDDDSGAVTDTYGYDAFGNVIARTGDTPNQYLYDGQRFDPDLGLYDLRARHYDPGRGRFLTLDTFEGDLTRPSSLNRYLYASADPVNLSDPMGMEAALSYGQTSSISLAAGAAIALVGSGIAAYYSCAAAALVGPYLEYLFFSSTCSPTSGPIVLGAKPVPAAGPLTAVDVPTNPAPFTGTPNSTVRGGTQSRTYGPDGYPLTDRDLPHPDEAGPGREDHSHDWGRPAGGGPPKDIDRGPPRAPVPGDPPPPRGPNVPPP